MKHSDFRFVRAGQPIKALSLADLAYLQPINMQKKDHNRALLLLHGFSSTPGVYRLMLPELQSYDAIIGPTLPGHAESILAFETSSAQAWLDCANHACRELCKQYEHVDVLGLSLGGLLACYLANEYPLNHLYLLAPALSLQLNIPIALAFAKSCHALGFRYLRNRAGNLYNRHECELTYRQLPLSCIIELLSFIKSSAKFSLTCPTDLFLGRHDAVVDSNRVAAQFADNPQTTIHWLEQAAHVLALENEWKKIVRCVNANQKKHSTSV